MQVRDAMEQFLLAKYNLRHRTKRLYKDILERFTDWCERERIELEQVKPPVVRRYLSELSTQASTTLHERAQVIKVFLSWCTREEDYEELVSEKTVRRIQLPKIDKTIIRIFTKDEINTLFKACRKEDDPVIQVRDRAILSLLLDCGLRLSEIGYDGGRPQEPTGLRMQHVFLSESYLRILGKGGKEREVGMGKRARAYLEQYINHYRGKSSSPFVFLSRRGGPLSISSVDETVRRLARMAGVDECHPHKFRHTFACLYLLDGGDIYKLSRLMGHSKVEITQLYLRAVQDMQLRQNGLSVLDSLQ